MDMKKISNIIRLRNSSVHTDFEISKEEAEDAIMYIDDCAENPDVQIDLETFWKDLMRQAMEAQDVQDMFRICSLIMNE